MGVYTGVALDGQVLSNPKITGGYIRNADIEADVYQFDGLTSLYGGFDTYTATVTVANGATTGKEAAIAMPANFLPIAMAFAVTVASTNACSLVDVGDDADTDSYCDGIVTNDLTTTGLKGIVGCNGVRALGDITGGVQVATTTADEVEIVVSADPGATGVTLRLTFFGVRVSTTDFS